MATKAVPNQIRYDDMIIFVEKTAALRVQNLGLSIDMDWEKIRQIGDDRVLDYDGELGSTMTMDSNSWATIDLLAQLTTRQHATTPVVNQALAQGGGVGVADDAAHTFTMKTFRDAQNRRCDIIIPIREGDNFERSMYVPNLVITGMEYTYTVDGIGSENYTLSGLGEVLHAVGLYKDLRVARCVYASANTCTTTDTGVDLDLSTPDHVVVGVNVNGDMFFKGPADYNFAFATDTLTVTYSVGGAAANIFSSGDRITMLYVALAAATDHRADWADVVEASHPTADSPLDVDLPGLAKVERGMVEIYYFTRNFPADNDLANNETNAVLMTRVQQVGFSLDLTGEELFQIGQQLPYARDYNDNVTVNLTLNESDIALIAALSGRTDAEIDDYKNDTIDLFNSGTRYTDPRDAGIVSMGDFFREYSNQALDPGVIVKIYSDRAKTTLMKTITVREMELTGHEPISQSVNGRNTLTFQFTSQDIEIVGSAASPF